MTHLGIVPPAPVPSLPPTAITVSLAKSLAVRPCVGQSFGSPRVSWNEPVRSLVIPRVRQQAASPIHAMSNLLNRSPAATEPATATTTRSGVIYIYIYLHTYMSHIAVIFALPAVRLLSVLPHGFSLTSLLAGSSGSDHVRRFLSSVPPLPVCLSFLSTSVNIGSHAGFI